MQAIYVGMIRGVMLDMSGVLYSGGAAVSGAPEAFERLRARLPVRLVTNTTRRPRRKLLEMLGNFGFEVKAEELLTPAAAALARLDALGCRPHLLVHPDLVEDFAGSRREGPEAVVLGDAGPLFTYERLNAAFRRLIHGAPFLALAANRVFLDEDGELSLDAGAFVKALEHASGVDAEVLGKPAPGFFAAAARSMGCRLDEVAMVGDDAEADVAGALRAGAAMAILVRTGKYRPGDETRVTPPPTAVVDDFPAAVETLLAAAGD